jgi:hypothetical protein
MHTELYEVIKPFSCNSYCRLLAFVGLINIIVEELVI